MIDPILKTKKTRAEEKANSLHVQYGYSPSVAVNEGLAKRILVISGLPGSGKTLIASKLAYKLKAVHLNADQVRQTVNKHLGFDKISRMTQAEALGNMARWIADAGQRVIVDFICPDFDTREAFISATVHHSSHIYWVEITRPELVCRFEDTKKMYEPLHSSPFLSMLHINFLHVINNEQPVDLLVNKIQEFYN